MTNMLASVNCLGEALLAIQAGVDLIDLKQPQHGALGALPVTEVNQIVAALKGKKPVSATVGDLPMQTEIITHAVTEMAQTGVDFIKIGFFPDGDWLDVSAALRPLAKNGKQLIAVLFADAPFDLDCVAFLAASGFTGVMLDTMHKDQGNLLAAVTVEHLQDFISTVRGHGLLCGLAGSLGQDDIAPLLRLHPDYLGFRGALCRAGQRTSRLDYAALLAVRKKIPITIGV